MVVVADAGMLSGSNLKELDAAHLRFFVGSRVTKAPNELASLFRWQGDAFTDGQVIDTVTPQWPRPAPGASTTSRSGPSRSGARRCTRTSWRAVWAYSTKRAARDTKTLTAQESKAKAVVAGEKAARTPRFVTTGNGARSLDEAALARTRRLVGLKGLRHQPARQPHAGR